ncbi:MAG: redoxin domain-containing protein [Saprospiraceae bacterium]|nr:redoxin domain-containing protein [Saprospiraceae bacterium]
MKRTFATFLLATFSILFLSAANPDGKGYKIRVKLDNYPQQELILGWHYGEKQYVKDTVAVDADGWFTFQADTMLPCGVYLLVLKPDNNFVQLLINSDEQQLTVTGDAKNVVGTLKIKGSPDNELFYNYLRFLNEQRPESDTLRAQLSRAKGNPADSTRIAGQILAIDKKVKKYQTDLIAKHPSTLSAKIIKASMEPEVPEFTGDEKEVQRKKYYWARAHYFDNLTLGDECLLHSPILFSKVDYYVNKMIPQHPDSINMALDYVLGQMKSSPENYKYFLIHFLNYYAKSTFVGMDACYVHLAKNYYCTNQAPWMKKEDLEKICDNAARLEPILIGKIAPNITVKDRNNQPVTLWDVDADYTVLFFWDPECSHCKKSAPYMVEFATKFKDRGVKVFAVCTAVSDKGPECWKSIEEKGFSDFLFLNTYDPYIQSRYKTLYDVKTTPQIFILDRSHEILMKRIGAEQLPQVMEEVMRFQEEKKKNKR